MASAATATSPLDEPLVSPLTSSHQRRAAAGRPARDREPDPLATARPPPNSADAAPWPLWWLLFLPVYWVPQNIGSQLIQTYVIPFQVESIVGDANKHMAYSLMMISKQIGSLFSPVWGSVADNLVGKDGRQCRRWMIVVGMLLWSADTAFMGLSSTFPMLMLSYLLYTATATVSGAPYVTVYQMVPTRQRGKLVAFDKLESFLVIACKTPPPTCPVPAWRSPGPR
jgi:hypothetical protein